MTGRLLLFFCAALGLLISPATSASDQPCTHTDRACIISELATSAAGIDTPAWRDQTYRELAKLLTAENRPDEAVALLPLIENPDTRAMTIRGIGMEAASLKLNKESKDALFATLREKAETISHAPSYAIALTYIAMAQAFSGDHNGAWATAAAMENDALRHKAYAETAEIQAENGAFQEAMTSIGKIESLAFRNKAYGIIARILTDKGMTEAALTAALSIDNPYQRSSALLYLLHSPRTDPLQRRSP